VKSPTAAWAEQQRRAMVEMQLRRRGIRDERVLEAMEEVPRHEFVAAEEAERAYQDHPLPIGRGQTISQPYMVGLMLAALELQGHERVLEIGTGSGYTAALLARLAAKVFSIECDAELARLAGERLKALGLDTKVAVFVDDGSLGCPQYAPFEGIVVAAAAPRVPTTLIDQLTDGGRLVIPVGSLEDQELRVIRRFGEGAVSRSLGLCRFVPLTGRFGWPLDPGPRA
jgi:protein-L-isoaspartate(D-aspartate) O-methyltransferase